MGLWELAAAYASYSEWTIASRKTAFIRVWQPFPCDLNHARTSASTLIRCVIPFFLIRMFKVRALQKAGSSNFNEEII
jgi:hypothetical protein